MARTAIRDVYVAGVPIVEAGHGVGLDDARAVEQASAALDRLRRSS
jgi:hypothetical protein